MMVNTGLCGSLCSKERLSICVSTFCVPGRVPGPGWSLKRLLQNPAFAFPTVSEEVSSSTVLVFHPLVSCMQFLVQRVPPLHSWSTFYLYILEPFTDTSSSSLSFPLTSKMRLYINVFRDMHLLLWRPVFPSI